MTKTAFYYDCMNTLHRYLRAWFVPHDFHECHDGYQITFPWMEGDVVIHCGSYGASNGYLESYRCPWDGDDVTMLAIAEASRKIREAYAEYKSRQ